MRLLSYDRVAGFYDSLAHAFSLGRIRASKLALVSHLGRGARVLFIGCGSGEDAIAAAQIGCDVTCLDISSQMLARAARRASRAGVPLRCVQADVMSFRPEQPFDAAIANYFLNIFTEKDARTVLAAVTQLVRPEGLVILADFRPSATVQPGTWVTLLPGHMGDTSLLLARA